MTDNAQKKTSPQKRRRQVRKGKSEKVTDLVPNENSEGYQLLVRARAEGKPVSATGLTKEQFAKLITG